MRQVSAQLGPLAGGRVWPAALTLFFGAGLIPETIFTFNSPPLQLVTRPLDFAFISAFYGSVALLVREYLHRGRARWAGGLLLGAAAGAVNEGIIAGTWYRPYPGYAMLGGLDPGVIAALTVLHALVSTLMPVILAGLVFPDISDRHWLRRRGICLCLAMLACTTATGFVLPAHRADKTIVLGCVLVIVVVALVLPRPAPRATVPKPAPPPAMLRAAGAAATIAFYVVFAVVPSLLAASVPPASRGPWHMVPIVLMAGLFCTVVASARTWTRRPGWGPEQTLAIMTGTLLPPIAASLILPAAWQGLEPVVTIPALALLIAQSRRLQAVSADGCGGQRNPAAALGHFRARITWVSPGQSQKSPSGDRARGTRRNGPPIGLVHDQDQGAARLQHVVHRFGHANLLRPPER